MNLNARISIFQIETYATFCTTQNVVAIFFKKNGKQEEKE